MNMMTKQLTNSKMLFAILAASLALFLVAGLQAPHLAFADAFDAIDIDGAGVEDTDLEGGLFSDMNTILYIILAIGGAVVIACLIFAGIKLAGSQGNPQARTQGFIGLGMALIGGWVVYKALDLAGWIKGLSGGGDGAD